MHLVYSLLLFSVPEWRKRSSSMCNESPVPVKKPRYEYFYVLASESSASEDERSESVHSIQDRETGRV